MATHGHLSSAGKGRTAVFYTGICFLALVAAAGIWASTALGPGLGSDSAVYIAGGENLAAGRGLTWRVGPDRYKLSIHPPMYSAALAPFELVGIGGVDGSRWLALVLFAATPVLIGLLVFRTTRSVMLSLLVGGVALSTADMIRVYSSALTEGLYIVLLLAALCVASLYLSIPSWPRLIILALLSALAALTKYAGLSAVAALSIVILLAPTSPRSVKVRHLAAYFGVALAPFALWALGNILQVGSGVDRPLVWNGLPPEALKTAISIVSRWLLPVGPVETFLEATRTRYLMLIGLTAMAGLAAWSWWHWRQARREGTGQAIAAVLRGAVLATGVAYIAFHIGGVVLASPQPDTNQRTLLPLLPILLLLAGWVLWSLWETRSPAWRTVAALLVVVLVWNRPLVGYQTVAQLSAQGAGYSSYEWRHSPLVAAVRSMPADVIYTDDEGAIFFLAGRYPYSLPTKWNSATGRERPEYSRDLIRMRERLRGGGLLVLFSPSPRLPEYPPYEELTYGLEQIASLEDGRVYAWPE